jgi:hypothetical protein
MDQTMERQIKVNEMNANSKRVRTRFAPETRFRVRPVQAAAARAIQEAEFERLKSRLLRERLEGVVEPGLNGYVDGAAKEAAALAWVTPYPLLVFPVLFSEQAEAALVRARRQQRVSRISRLLLAA